VLLLAGCSSAGPAAATGPVDVVAVGVSGPQCGPLVAALPATLGALSRRPVTGEVGRTAAWGDPAVTLACGSPEANPAAEQLQLGPKEGGIVTFAIHDVGPATAFTTVGLPVPITVTVPDAYDSTLLVPITVVLLAMDR